MGKSLQKLIQAELEKKISTYQLAAAIGVSNVTLWKHAHCMATPTLETYDKYAAYFGIPFLRLVDADFESSKKAVTGDIEIVTRDESLLLQRYRDIKQYKQGDIVIDYVNFFLNRLQGTSGRSESESSNIP